MAAATAAGNASRISVLRSLRATRSAILAFFTSSMRIAMASRIARPSASCPAKICARFSPAPSECAVFPAACSPKRMKCPNSPTEMKPDALSSNDRQRARSCGSGNASSESFSVPLKRRVSSSKPIWPLSSSSRKLKSRAQARAVGSVMILAMALLHSTERFATWSAGKPSPLPAMCLFRSWLLSLRTSAAACFRAVWASSAARAVASTAWRRCCCANSARSRRSRRCAWTSSCRAERSSVVCCRASDFLSLAFCSCRSNASERAALRRAFSRATRAWTSSRLASAHSANMTAAACPRDPPPFLVGGGAIA
mmetsp:Transcript_92728/g.198777  ORF Transcript_92728/g.198777 Transcript_92728/m.198777 type:complete len:311 (+) Transcript_92728:558-1490(+)